MKKTYWILFYMCVSWLAWIIWWIFAIVFFAGHISPISSLDSSKWLQNTTSTTLQTVNIQSLENTLTQLAQEVSPSVVSIVIKKDLPLYQRNPFGFFRSELWSIETELGGWTGFFVDTAGTIITNKHVVRDPNANYSVVLNNWEIYDARILGLDPVNDLALIKVDYESIPMKIATKSDKLNIGQFVIAIWNALSEFQNSVSFWVVSGKNRIIQAWWEDLSSLIQTDTAINPGNSWGPLIDMTWKVIGINTAIASWQWLGFSISLTSEKVAYMLDSIEKYGEIKKPFIGIYYIPLNSRISEELWISYDYGIYIPEEEWSIISWSAASDSGIQTWDIILSVDWQKITQEFSLDIILQNSFPWEKLKLEILRGWELRNIELELWKI